MITIGTLLLFKIMVRLSHGEDAVFYIGNLLGLQILDMVVTQILLIIFILKG